MKSLFKRSVSMLLAVVMLVLMVPTTLAVSSSAESMSKDEQWAHIQGLIAEFADKNTWTTSAYSGAVRDVTPKTALLGNGDVGVTSNGNASSKSYILSSTDFWSDNATWKSGKRSPQLITGGGMTVEAYDKETGSALTTTNSAFSEYQDIARAEIKTSQYMGETKVQLVNWISAEKNIMVTAITSESDLAQTMRVLTWGNGNNAQYLPRSAGTGEQNGQKYIWATRKSNITPDNGHEAVWMSEFAMASKLIGAEGEYSATDTGAIVFDLPAGKTVYVVTSIECAPYQELTAVTGVDGLAVQGALDLLDTVKSESDIDALHKAHLEWWKNYYLLSWVDMGTTELNRLYYGNQYIFGCSTREGSEAPGLYSVWITNDTAKWQGDFHLNYNFQGPYYGSYSSNRMQEFSDPMFQTFLDYIDEGIKRAGDPWHLEDCSVPWYYGTRKDEAVFQNGFEDSILLPVGLFPYGPPLVEGYLNQTGNALFCADQIITYYKYSMDYEWLTTKQTTASGSTYSLYDFLAKTANFYTYWVEKKGARIDDEYIKDGGQFVPTEYTANYAKYPEYDESMGDDYVYVLFDAAHEGSYEFNPGVVLGNLQYLTDLLVELGLETAKASGYTEERFNAWKDLSEHLVNPAVSAFVDEQSGLEMFGLSEDRGYRNISATVELEWIHPAYQLGFNSDPEELEIARNTVTVTGQYGKGYTSANATPKIYTQAARVGYDADTIIARMKQHCISAMAANNYINDNTHGWEKAGILEALNTMMVMSDGGIIKVFPTWNNSDAQFHTVRMPGAFLVSSELKSGKVQYVDVTSEVGGQLKLVIPWDVDQYDYELVDLATGSVVPCSQAITENSEDYYLIANTEAGHTYRLRSTKLSETATPKVPVNLTAEAVSHTQLKASWEKNPQEGESVTYKVTVENSQGVVKTVDTDETSAAVTDLAPDTEYTVSVQAVYASGNVSDASDSVSVKLPPSAEDKPVIISVQQPDSVAGALGAEVSALQLPATVKARVYSNESGYQDVDIPVTWNSSGYNANKNDAQVFPGTLDAAYNNPSNLQVEIAVFLGNPSLAATASAAAWNQLLNLTELGNVDWLQVNGSKSGPQYVRKNNVAAMISDLTFYDGKQYSTSTSFYDTWDGYYPIRTSWTDGTPVAQKTDAEATSGSGKGSALLIRGEDSYAEFTVKTQPNEQVLTLSLGTWCCESTLEMWLASDPDNKQTVTIDNTVDKISGLDTASSAHYETVGAKIVTVKFASTANDKLVVRYTVTENYDSGKNAQAIIQAAALYDETLVEEDGGEPEQEQRTIALTKTTTTNNEVLNLTELGSTDWMVAHKTNSGFVYDRKKVDTALIGELQYYGVNGTGLATNFNGAWANSYPVKANWTDGTNTQTYTTASNSADTAPNTRYVGNYVTFTVPAQQYEQVLTLSLGAFKSKSTLELWFESDPNNKESITVDNTVDKIANLTTSHYDTLGASVISVKFSSTVENEKLVVRYGVTESHDGTNGQSIIQAITLSGEAPAPESKITVTAEVPDGGTNLNLTELGTADWVQTDGTGTTIRKNSGQIISDLKFTGNTGNWDGHFHTSTSWTDGKTTVSRDAADKKYNGRGIYGSVEFTVPAKTEKQTLTMSLGAFNTTCNLEMWLESDPTNKVTKSFSNTDSQVANAPCNGKDAHGTTVGARIFTVNFLSEEEEDTLCVRISVNGNQGIIQAIALDGEPVIDVSPIDEAIAKAQEAMKDVEVIAGKTSDEIPSSTKYVEEQGTIDTLNAAIATAEAAKENAASTANVTNAVNALNTAIETFNDSVKTGTYYSVTSVTLNKTVFYLSVGDSETLQATVAPPNATNKNLTWESSNESIVTVDQDGKVTAVSNGVATIVVTTADNVKIFATCIVSIKQPVVSVTLDKKAETVENGKTLQLTATVNPDNADDKTVTWKSSDEDVATVDENGLVTAVAKGEATITVTTTDGGKAATCNVIVTVDTSAIDSAIDVANGAMVDVEVSDSAEKVTAGNKFVTKAEMTALTDAITAATTAKENAKTSADVTKAVNALNEAVTTFTNAMKTGTYVAATGISLNKEVLELSVGKSEMLVVNITPAEATIKTVTWETSDDKVVTVDQNGKVKAVGKGVADVTVTLTDANGNKTTLSAVCAVDIKLDVSALQTAIDNATTAMNSVSVIDDKAENEVTKDTKFVTTEVKEALESAITAAKAAKEAAKTNEDVTSAISALTSAVNTFNSATKTGTYVAVTGISLNKSEVTLAAGSTDTLQAIIAPADATNQRVTWTSSDDKVVTVANGLVTAVGKGEATITVTTVDGNKSASCKFTVTLDTSAISSAIDAADAAKSGVKIIDDKTIGQVTTGTKFVTTAEMKALTDAIATAKEAKESAKTKADVTNAVNALNTAVDTFKQAIKIGIDVSAIDAALTAAEAAKSGVDVSDKSADQVTKGTKFVTTAEMKALNDAITAAKGAKAQVTSAEEVTNVANALNTAVDTFKQAVKTGTYEEKVETKVQITEGGIKEVPESLKKAGLETPEKVKEALVKAIIKANGTVEEANIAHYDVTFMYSDDDGKTWAKADEAHFPKDGKLQITLPYPKGTDKTYTFTVVHMFTSAAFGKTPGDVEMPKVTNGADGISFAVTGLSPITVSWTAPEAPEHDCEDSGHKLTKVDAKAATTEAEGNIEHYICSECGKYFSDAAGKTEIKKESVVIPKLTVEDETKPTDPTEKPEETKPTEPEVTDPTEKPEESKPTDPKDPTEATKPESDTPDTGDHSNMALFITMMLISLAAVAFILLWDKRSFNGKYFK